MADSILDSVKKYLGLGAEYEVFDQDIMMHINTAIAVLTQIGIGPTNGFMIEDEYATWDALLGQDPRLSMAKSYIYYKVRLAFDPPASSFHIASLEKQAEEMYWRLHMHYEHEIAPTVVIVSPNGV